MTTAMPSNEATPESSISHRILATICCCSGSRGFSFGSEEVMAARYPRQESVVDPDTHANDRLDRVLASQLPLSRTRPREARYASVLVALLCYLIYLGWLGFGRALIEQGKTPSFVGLWWVHLPAAGLALWLLWRSDRLAVPAAAGERRKSSARGERA